MNRKMQKIIPALIKAKAGFSKIQKDGKNPHYKAKYATLDSVLDAVTTSLSANGLCIVQTLEGYNLKTFLYHESGEFLESFYPLPQGLDSQKFGAAITYARRYSVCAILSITADEDDDGESNRVRSNDSRTLSNTDKIAKSNDISPQNKNNRIQQTRYLNGLSESTDWDYIPDYVIDRDLINKEIESLMKRKSISIEMARNLLIELFGVKGRSLLTDKQLVEFLDYLKSNDVKLNNTFVPIPSDESISTHPGHPNSYLYK